MSAFTNYRTLSPTLRLPARLSGATEADSTQPAPRRSRLADAALLAAGLLAGLALANYTNARPATHPAQASAAIVAPAAISTPAEILTGVVPPQTLAPASAARLQKAAAQAAALRDVLDDLGPTPFGP
jgi:hypothetical protein